MSVAAIPGRRRLHIGFWQAVIGVVLLLFGVVLSLRYALGLGATTHLSDSFPWGLWVGFDVLSRVGLAAGAFTLATVIHIFNLRRFEPILRPAVLTGLLCYLFVGVTLLIELGQPWRIWHPVFFWNPHSVMFEVAWCVMLYLTVLVIEFSPTVFEKLRLEGPVRVLRAVTTPIVILGFILSTMHQSSLGSLYLIVPSKLHPLWYSPLLPLLFYISAIAAGIGMLILESYLSQRAFGRRLELELLEPLGRAMVVTLGFYGLLRFQDLFKRGALSELRHPGYEAWLFMLEIGLGVVAPVVLLAVPRVRGSDRGLVAGALLVVLGFVMSRLNVAVTGMERVEGQRYVPSWMEFSISLGMIAAMFVLFALAVRYLPIFPERCGPAEEEAA